MPVSEFMKVRDIKDKVEKLLNELDN
ncbi:uncharacterized protein METZ01_LOCUS158512 [marine metagenome]|uniref:Uncharacterized protein n=1 Tax=marine metagenome TaxID=408172 RepID=A0A382AW43_9ZZZZ